MFRALLAHPEEVLHKRQLVYCVRVMSVGCYQDWSGTTPILVQHKHTYNIPSAVCVAPPQDEQVMLETCRGP
jgi:hypothetical protein